jgi:hypothetical protein
MREKLEVAVSEHTGLPYAIVPTKDMWDLVEYLSFQRMAVTYEYRADHFTVCFLKTDVATAQRLLDEWGRSPAQLMEQVS